MFALIIAIIALIVSITTFTLITIDSTEWGKSELIDKANMKLAELREKREERYWARH